MSCVAYHTGYDLHGTVRCNDAIYRALGEGVERSIGSTHEVGFEQVAKKEVRVGTEEHERYTRKRNHSVQKNGRGGGLIALEIGN